ncbi:MAG: hypothetical protein IH588_00880 [Anaerolineales bacterium]|nr:hypothetical protein [Anaerolineales bacterium]
MPIRYDIHPGLDFLLYIFEGECSAREYFDLYHSIYLKDKRRHHGMKILMDLYKGKLYFEVEDLREARELMAKNKEEGHPRDRVAVLSKSSSMSQLTDTLKLIADNLPMELELFHNFHDSARWLGLAEHENEAMRFWHEFTQGKKQAP